MLDVVSDVKRLAGAAETLFAARVAETEAWQGGGDRVGGALVGAPHRHLDRRSEGETRHRGAGWLSCRRRRRRFGRVDCRINKPARSWRARSPIRRPSATLLGTAAQDSLRELRNESRRAQAVDDERRPATHDPCAAPAADGGRYRWHLPAVVRGYGGGGCGDRGRVAAVHRSGLQTGQATRVGSSPMPPIRPTGSWPWPKPPPRGDGEGEAEEQREGDRGGRRRGATAGRGRARRDL